MQIVTKLSHKRTVIGVVAAAWLCAAMGTTASTAMAAGEGKVTSSDGKSSTTWSWSFGNSVSFGNNQTKGSGLLKEEIRNVANFSRLTLRLPATVTLSQGPVESLSIRTDDNLLPLMMTRVENGDLIIEGDKSRGFSSKKELKIRLVVKSLNGIKIEGSGDVFGDQLKSDKLDIAITGSGDVKFKAIRADQLKIGIVGSGDVAIDTVESKSLESNITGSGDVKLLSLQADQVSIAINGSGDVSAAGNADKVDIQISGSGDVSVRKLIAREVSVKLAASGDADVHATEKLTASVSGSGDIRYAGSPKKVEREVRGSGSIEAL
jgi:Putative auto-transporter adhesin, head GIN domain